MRGNSKAVPFHGILAVGSTKDEAVNRYRLLALGKGVSAFVDQGKNLAFVSNASSKLPEMFNPQSGELDLVKDESILDGLEFEAKAGEVEANHYVCESGCGIHIVYDSEQLVQCCPSCTTAIASDEDEDEVATASAEDDEVSLSGDDEEEEDLDEEDEEEDDEDEDDSEDDEDDEDEDDSDEDDDEDDEDDSDDEDEDDEDEEDDSSAPLVIAADSKEKAVEIYQNERQGIATAATTVEVEYKVCASAECGAHVLTEDESLSACPACDAELKEPAATTETTIAPTETPAPVHAASEDEEEEDEEEDESDLEVIPDEEEEEEGEEEEEEVSESTTQPTTVAPAAAPAPEANLEQIEVNMLQRMADNAEHTGLDVSFSSSIGGKAMWTAFIDGVPIATATAADAGKNADIFTDAAFGHAIIAGAKHAGVKTVLTEMGFKGITHSVSVSSIINEKVEAQVAEAKASLGRDQNEYSERLLSALATAAIGLNRGFFPGESNPVKAALFDALSAVGVKNAEVVIHNAFRTSADEYHKALFARACDIVAKPLEVQESLAKAVLGTNYMGASESSSATNSLEDRLAGMGTVTASTTPASQETIVTKPEDKQESLSSDARISNVVAGLGRRR